MAGATATDAWQRWVGPCLQRKLRVYPGSCAHGAAPDPTACMKGLNHVRSGLRDTGIALLAYGHSFIPQIFV